MQDDDLWLVYEDEAGELHPVPWYDAPMGAPIDEDGIDMALLGWTTNLKGVPGQ